MGELLVASQSQECNRHSESGHASILGKMPGSAITLAPRSWPHPWRIRACAEDGCFCPPIHRTQQGQVFLYPRALHCHSGFRITKSPTRSAVALKGAHDGLHRLKSQAKSGCLPVSPLTLGLSPLPISLDLGYGSLAFPIAGVFPRMLNTHTTDPTACSVNNAASVPN